MDINFKKVHTGKDLAISSIVLLAGIGLFFVNKGLGVCIAICGLAMFFICKGGHKIDGEGVLLIKYSEDICKSCRGSLMDFINGKGVAPMVKKGDDGGSVRLDVYYNKAESVAYAQLFDFCNYAYEPVTDIVRFDGDKADILISAL